MSNINDIVRELRDDYPAVDVTTVVFSRDFAGIGCCVIPQDRVLAIIKSLEAFGNAQGRPDHALRLLADLFSESVHETWTKEEIVSIIEDAIRLGSPLPSTHQPSPATEATTMTEDQIKHMVNRFLSWKLPSNFSPDAGISFKADFNEHTAHPMKHEPSGTNLFDATQADAMVRYMVAGMPAVTSTDRGSA